MKSGPKNTKLHQLRSYRRLLRPQKDLKAFFGPLFGVLGILGIVSIVISGGTTGRQGVMPEYETNAVRICLLSLASAMRLRSKLIKQQ